MRFGLTRSPSPSPVRDSLRPRPSSTFGLNDIRGDHSSDDEDLSNDLSYDSGTSSQEDDFGTTTRSWQKGRSNLQSTSRRTPIRSSSSAPNVPSVSQEEQRQLAEAMASIRLRSRYNDPYEEWERNVRKESFKTARRNHATSQAKLRDDLQAAKDLHFARLKAHTVLQRQQIDDSLAKFRERQDKENLATKELYKQREAALWKSIDAAIAMDTDKIEKRLAAEKQERDAEEMRKKEEELKRRLAEEKKRVAEEKQRSEEEAKRKADAEKKQKEDEEAKKAQEDMEKVEAEKKARRDKVSAEKGVRDELGFAVAQDDWWAARKFMTSLKTDIMPLVKNKGGTTAELKSAWGAHRRQITPRIGQVTEDMNDINRVTNQITQIMLPPSGHNQTVYYGLLSALAKCILTQAETEVSYATESNPALPLAQVTFNFIERLDGFGDVLWARLVTRTGGWAVPYPVGATDWDGQKWKDQEEWKKAIGYRQMQAIDGGMVWETDEQYNARIGGIMRVYFTLLKIKPTSQPLKGAMWQTPMFWRWIARLLGSDGGGRVMLEKSVAADVLATGLSVMGSDAKAIWGHQFVKVLALIYEGITMGFGDKSGAKIGGPSPEGSAARLRLRLAIERIMST